MAKYAIGDIQGCYNPFMELLSRISFNPSKDILYLVGDLVNRGPESLKVLEWVYEHQDSVITVLGNHDFYLLARYNNLISPVADDTIDDILHSKNATKLIDWLRRAPVVFHDADYILVHAGIYPILDFNQVLAINHAISNHLQAKDYAELLLNLFNGKSHIWSNTLNLSQQMNFVINSCTRIRYLNTLDLSIDYKFKGALAKQPSELIPWFKADFNPTINKKIIFGHWAALGFWHDDKVISLDTGCVWGRKLTAINLENFEITQV